MALAQLTKDLSQMGIEEPSDPRPFHIIFGCYTEVSAPQMFYSDLFLTPNLQQHVKEARDLLYSTSWFFGHSHFKSYTWEGPASKDPRMMYGHMFLKVVTPTLVGTVYDFDIEQAGINSMAGCDMVDELVRWIEKLPNVSGIFYRLDSFDQPYWDSQRLKYQPYHKN